MNTEDTKFKHTKNNFKEWLNKATYTEVLDMYQTYKNKLFEYRGLLSKTKTLYSKGEKKENIKIVKYKYNLLTNKLNLITLKGGK
jgi:hypothetical protein